MRWIIHGPPERSGLKYGFFERWHQDGPGVDFNLTISFKTESGLTRVWCGTEEMEHAATVGSGVFFTGGTTHSEPWHRDGRLSLLLRIQRKGEYRSMDPAEFLELLRQQLLPKLQRFLPEPARSEAGGGY